MNIGSRYVEYESKAMNITDQELDQIEAIVAREEQKGGIVSRKTDFRSDYKKGLYRDHDEIPLLTRKAREDGIGRFVRFSETKIVGLLNPNSGFYVVSLRKL